MYPCQKYRLLFLIIVGIHFSTSLLADTSISNTVYFYASQSGEKTLDQGEGGGNPFASALIELLSYETLAYEDFQEKLAELTENKSRHFQRPEISTKYENIVWQISPKADSEKRVALVVVFSDYSVSGITSLPGAKHDAERTSKALETANFTVETIVDPGQSELNDLLDKFMKRLQEYDVAAIYTTGHGVEIDGTVYLLPGDYPLSNGKAQLNTQAIQLSQLGNAAHAKKMNLVFYGGCRNNPF